MNRPPLRRSLRTRLRRRRCARLHGSRALRTLRRLSILLLLLPLLLLLLLLFSLLVKRLLLLPRRLVVHIVIVLVLLVALQVLELLLPDGAERGGRVGDDGGPCGARAEELNACGFGRERVGDVGRAGDAADAGELVAVAAEDLVGDEGLGFED